MAEININHWLHFSGTRAADEIILDGILIHLQFILYLILFRILRRSFIQSEWRQVPPLSNSSDLFSEHATIILVELFIHLLKWNRNLGLKNSCNFLYSSNFFFPLPFSTRFPLSNLSCLHFRTDWLSRLGLGNQVGSTTDHLANCYLPSTPKDRSMMKEELTE